MATLQIPNYVPCLMDTVTIAKVAYGEIDAEIQRLMDLRANLRDEMQERIRLHDDATDPEGGCLIADIGEDECDICDFRTDKVA